MGETRRRPRRDDRAAARGPTGGPTGPKRRTRRRRRWPTRRVGPPGPPGLFTVPTLTLRACYALLLIAPGRRALVHVAVRRAAAWICCHLAAVMAWGRWPRHLVRDPSPADGGDAVGRAAGPGTETVAAPVRAPRANAIAEGAVRPPATGALSTSSRSTRRTCRRPSLRTGPRTGPRAPAGASASSRRCPGPDQQLARTGGAGAFAVSRW
jgi:hypothetical protein